jgi:hypothetical protein
LIKKNYPQTHFFAPGLLELWGGAVNEQNALPVSVLKFSQFYESVVGTKLLVNDFSYLYLVILADLVQPVMEDRSGGHQGI